MTDLLVAAAQFVPGTGDNLPAMADLVAKAVARGARVVVFPEYSSYFPLEDAADPAAVAQSLDGEFVTDLIACAAAHEVTIVAGFLETGDGVRVRNTLVAVDAGGVLATYRKQHLYDAFGQRESDRILAGELTEPETFTVDGLVFGLITCYDLRFPESTRRLADAGADVIVVPAEWVRGPLKEDHWATLVRARAIENTAYVVAADQAPPTAVGRSMIVDPSGVVLASLGATTDVVVAPISGDEIARVRAVNPALELRRFAVVPRN